MAAGNIRLLELLFDDYTTVRATRCEPIEDGDNWLAPTWELGGLRG